MKYAPKLTDADRTTIRELKAQGQTYKALAAQYGVSMKTIWRTVRETGDRGAGPVDRAIDTSGAIRINDDPDTLTAALMGDPSPERLRLVHGDRF